MMAPHSLLARRTRLYSSLVLLAIALLIDSRRAFAAPQVSNSRASVALSHIFLQPKPGWISQVSYLKYLDEDQGYEGVSATEQNIQSHRYYKEIRYFKNAQDAKDPNKECKLLQYDPQGHLQREIDRVGPDLYNRDLYADGSLRIYTHWHEPDLVHGIGPWVEGVSLSPLKKVLSRFSGGSGEFISWGADGDTYHRWYFHGNEYLEKEFAQGKCCKVRLNEPHNVDYEWTPQKETLWAESSSEFWMKFNGRPPFDVSPHDMRDTRPKFNQPKEQHEEHEETVLQAQRTLDYGRRRAQFMAAYGALLVEAGQSWKGLGLESIRDGAGPPKQAGTSEP